MGGPSSSQIGPSYAGHRFRAATTPESGQGRPCAILLAAHPLNRPGILEMYEGLLLDFYGTLVEEDTKVITRIVERIAQASPLAPQPADVAANWAHAFSSLCSTAYGKEFRLQRELELQSLHELLEQYAAPLDPEELSIELYEYWTRPHPLPGAREFLDQIRVPTCLVSNIDSQDLQDALATLGWNFDHVITSERSRSYKPRVEPFEAALALIECSPKAALHVGDSIGSDVKGAAAAGIAVAWINPGGRTLPEDFKAKPRFVVARVSELTSVLGEEGHERFN
jgi:HAD superfamily hydrolase (TIGR01509 family)